MSIKNRVAIVTGSGRGIGKAIALRLAKDGTKLTVTSRTSKELEETTEEIRNLGSEVLAIRADISNPEDCEKIINETEKHFKKIDILVNNAGSPGINEPLENCKLKDWEEILKTNLTSIFLCSKFAIPIMKKNQFGRIINISSGGGIHPIPNMGPYGVSKSGVIALTRSFSSEIAKDGITVNCITPGLVKTKMVMDNLEKLSKQAGISSEEFIKMFEQANHLNHIGRDIKAEEVAETVFFLCQKEAFPITGEVISHGGGWFAG